MSGPGDELQLASLLVSRLCHDLAAPAGAVGNGIEMLREELGQGADASLELIEFSAVETTRRLELFRLAFGVAGNATDVATGDVRAVALAFFAGRKVRLEWPPGGPERLPQLPAKLALNLVLLAFESLPKGGSVVVEVGPGRIAATAAGTGAALAVGRHEALAGAAPANTLTAHSAVAFHAGLVARAAGGEVAADDGTPGRLVLSATYGEGA